VRHVGGDEFDAGLLEAEQEVRVARQTVELGDEGDGAALPGGKRVLRAKSIAALGAVRTFYSRARVTGAETDPGRTAASRGI